MKPDSRFNGILYMLLAALCFSIMGGAAKALKENFNAGQLVFYRNAVGLFFFIAGIVEASAGTNRG
jgi:drug/metabolite transporter (DMT)-like permease